VTGGYGSLSQDSSRRSESAFVGESSADFDTDLAFVTVELNYDFQLSDTVEVSPFVQLNYQDVSTDGFSEDGAAADAGDLNSIERDWMTGELGVRSVLTISENLSALASVSWEHNFESDDIELSGDFQGVSAPGIIDVSTVGESRFKASLSIAYMIDEQWAISAGVDVSSGDDVDTFGGGLVLNRSF
jgi:outer membrane autotransporter protein